MRCLHVGEQYLTPVRFGWKVWPQPSQVSSGWHSRRFSRAIPLRAAASHSREQVISLGARLLMVVTKGRPQFKHVMAFSMLRPFLNGKLLVRFRSAKKPYNNPALHTYG